MFVKFVQAKRALLNEVELKVDFRAFLANIRRAAESVPFANFITAARVYLYAESICVVQNDLLEKPGASKRLHS